MQTPIELLYTAHPSPYARAFLEQALSAGGIECSPIYTPAFDGLSPSNLFKHRNCSFSHYQFALVADDRTLQELDAQLSPTLLVVSTRRKTPMEEWAAYEGPDLNLLSWNVRLALLRAMAQERFTTAPSVLSNSEWFWEPPEKPYRYEGKIFQVRWLRASVVGAVEACLELLAKDQKYSSKDNNEMYDLLEAEAAKTGGVFTGRKIASAVDTSL
ncbi:hypothetical protein C8F01DRAFT_1102331 [Mycena amicta]|nr:hypothetical protein C8F01DRAFT_1102331 [Mycena amicta]